MITESQVNAASDQLIQERGRAFFTVGLPILLIFGTTALISGEWALLALAGTALAVIGFGYSEVRHGRVRPLTVRAGIAIYTLMALYLIAYAGPDHGRALWFYTLPLISIMLMPPRIGLTWTAGALIAAIAVMIFCQPSGDTLPYSTTFIVRFALTIAILSGALYWSEISLRAFQEETTVQRLALETERERLNSEIARRGMLEKELRQQATTDALTGLLNRRAFMERFTNELSRAQRHGPMPTLIILDIDHFKKINDGYGHPAGDAVLVHLAQLLRASLRNVDLVGRIGGEEFALLLIETDSNAAEPVIERLLERIRKTQVHLPDGEAIHFTSSIGSTAVQWGDVVDTAIQRADEALYTAKNSGRNRHVRR